jgi:hypothetical protein
MIIIRSLGTPADDDPRVDDQPAGDKIRSGAPRVILFHADHAGDGFGEPASA